MAALFRYYIECFVYWCNCSSSIDASILFAGTGECDIRGNISFGEGIYKSTNAGVSWKYSGLRESGSIAKISIHPKNPDEIIIASMGHVFGSNPERGIYKSIDGGDSWKKCYQDQAY